MMLTDFKNTWLSNHIDDFLGSYPDKGAGLDVGSLSVGEREENWDRGELGHLT